MSESIFPLPSDFTGFDRALIDYLHRLASSPSDELNLAVSLLNLYGRAGHTCVDLSQFATVSYIEQKGQAAFHYPSLDSWLSALQASGVVGQEGDHLPLILDEHHLYFHRLWQAQSDVAELLRLRCDRPSTPKLNTQRDKYINQEETPDLWHASQLIAEHDVCFVVGGPGTGKTTIVNELINFLKQAYDEAGESLSVALLAPTGKASARLRGAVCYKGSEFSQENTTIRHALTIHRFLQLPLEESQQLNLLVVDEASMIDLVLMQRLLKHMSNDCKLILLGDSNQLASVEAGSVLNELSMAKRQLLELKTSYRFKADSGIAKLATQVCNGDAQGGLDLMEAAEHNDVFAQAWMIKANKQLDRLPSLSHTLVHFRAIRKLLDPAEALAEMSKLQILCALRQGDFGVEGINDLMESQLGLSMGTRREQFYAYRPILISRNSLALSLFNGDLGIIMPNEAGDLRAYFISAEGELSTFLPQALPAHETAYAMTIHKSQGSEYNHAVVMLPPFSSPIITRELIYTAITRAREQVSLYYDPASWLSGVEQKVVRYAGLAKKLTNNPSREES